MKNTVIIMIPIVNSTEGVTLLTFRTIKIVIVDIAANNKKAESIIIDRVRD